ncbi:YhdP family phospholipid transporter [Halomonas sp. 86]|uniref:YhdP family phospholipid transporter n=1 Tax=unclassified Halomonas TaxID=2609666 RepID=UPI0040344FE0
MTIRSLTRWSLLLLAWGLGGIAVIALLFRLMVSQADTLTPHVEAFLEAQIGVPVTIENLSFSMARSELIVELEGFGAETPSGQPLFSLRQAELRLDIGASLRNLLPIFSDIRLHQTEFHLYQGVNDVWQWPEPAKLPVHIAPEPDVDLPTIDAWTEWVLRQQIWIDDTRVVLHGKQERVMLEAPALLLAGNQQGAKLQGTVDVLDSERSEAPPIPAVQLLAEMQPGRDGLNDFSATLKLEAQFDQLLTLVELFRPEHVPNLEQAGGDARVWGRWYEGGLQEVRLAIDIPELVLRQDIQFAVLRNIQAQGEWQREGEGGEAWLSGNAESVDWAEPGEAIEGPALPHHWYLSHRPGQWALRTSAFELASLTAWRDYVLLPESVTRVLETLAPRGRVQGLSLGQKEGSWEVDAALTNVEVSPWEGAPGGGPMDAWVQARDSRGRVTFNSAGDSSLYFPDLFTEPMQLQQAEGIVEWVYDGPNTMVSGRQINVDWDDAQISGGFGLVVAEETGRFGLDIDFANVDALERPLGQWLPLHVFDEELRDWLLDDIGGKVPNGSLKLSLPIESDISADDISATLALKITEGHLPIAPGWPRLEDVEGRLTWQNQVLEARVEHAQSRGITASQGELTMQDEILNVSGNLHGDGSALIAFLTSIPDVDMNILNDLQAEGEVEADLAISLPLEAPDNFQLEVNAVPALTRIAYAPVGGALQAVKGQLTWQQYGDSMALIGSVDGQLLGGDISADMHTQRDGIRLRGQTPVASLFSLVDIPAEQGKQLLDGTMQWQGRVTLEPSPALSLESQLEGVRLDLPEPFAKAAGEPWPWTLNADFDSGRVESRLADIAHLRLKDRLGDVSGNLHVADTEVSAPEWPMQSGFRLQANLPRIDPMAWQQAVAPLFRGDQGVGGDLTAQLSGQHPPLEFSLDTACLVYQQACAGGAALIGSVQNGTVTAALESDLVTGHLRYQQAAQHPLDITISQLALDRLTDLADTSGESETTSPDSWLGEVETQHTVPAAIPEWLAEVPDGRLRLSEMSMGESRFGPLSAYWHTEPGRFSLMPVGLTLGQLSARGELYWEGDASTSRTQANISIEGGDVGTALERMDQPVALRSRRTTATANLGWAGAPWQFSLNQAQGDIDIDMQDGRFMHLDSAPVRLVGLLNFDNILRRLRLDFSDVTGTGTAFDRVDGTADVENGQLSLSEPLQIKAPAANLTLTGNVNLLHRELDLRLGVVMPVTQTLPIAAIAVGAPVVGGALFIADQLFGSALDRATTIHYRARGPWTSPQVTLEGSE